MKNTKIYLVLFFCFLTGFKNNAQTISSENLKAPEEAVEAWKDLKFGLRIHWGLYSQFPEMRKGESWKLHELATNPEKYKEYQNSYKTFNPVKYDPNAWMDMMINAGMTFFSFTVKHHEGFSMYDTKYTVKKYVTIDEPNKPVIKDLPANFHYSIMDTPYKKDITAMLIKAATNRKLPYAQGITNFKIGLYYTDIDWFDADFRFGVRHPLYSPSGNDNSYTDTTDHAGYIRAHDHLIGEITEMCKLVPKNQLLSICFDMSFPKSTACIQMAHDIAVKARELQPNALFRSRCIDKSYADYFTPERSLPPTNENKSNWMVIYPLGKNFDFDSVGRNYKGTSWILKNLVDVVSKGGVFQIGLGPDQYGQFHPEAIKQLKETGKWLKINHECIYSTRPGAEYHALVNGKDSIRFTRTKDEQFAYVMCMTWPGEILNLKNIKVDDGAKITMLADQDQNPIKWTQDEEGLHLMNLSPLQTKGEYVWVFKVPGKIIKSE